MKCSDCRYWDSETSRENRAAYGVIPEVVEVVYEYCYAEVKRQTRNANWPACRHFKSNLGMSTIRVELETIKQKGAGCTAQELAENLLEKHWGEES